MPIFLRIDSKKTSLSRFQRSVSYISLIGLLSVNISDGVCVTNTKKALRLTNHQQNTLGIDTVQIALFFQKRHDSIALENKVRDFYVRRKGMLAWSDSGELSIYAWNFYHELLAYRFRFDDNLADTIELDSLMGKVIAKNQIFTNKAILFQADLLLTTIFLKYNPKEFPDIPENIPRTNIYNSIARDSLMNGGQEIVSQKYYLLKKHLINYRMIQMAGGFPLIVCLDKNPLIGKDYLCIADIKKYLVLTGDLAKDDDSYLFTDTLFRAVKHFQHRMGLVENGAINQATIEELNKPIEVRIRQMIVNLGRLRWMPDMKEQNYVLVNIPEFMLYVFQANKQWWKTKVIVGKPISPTRIFQSHITHIVVNPYWVIPKGILKNEILPKIRKNPNFLIQNNIELVAGKYQQKPGKNNALGRMKFIIPNNYSIYLHDTPLKSLFALNERAFSHGCIRLEFPEILASILLKKADGAKKENEIASILATRQVETFVQITPPMPIYIIYLTAWADEEGELHFRRDLYDLDATN